MVLLVERVVGTPTRTNDRHRGSGWYALLRIRCPASVQPYWVLLSVLSAWLQLSPDPRASDQAYLVASVFTLPRHSSVDPRDSFGISLENPISEEFHHKGVSV